MIDGDPRFDRRFAELNAVEMADEWIKHTYRNGFFFTGNDQMIEL